MQKYLKFSNKSAIGGNPIQKILYIFAYPFAVIAKKLNLTPNFLTFLSFFFTLISFIYLIKYNLSGFFSFWLIAYILDYADGTLARMTNSIRVTALRYDHFSDLLKISLIFLGFGLYYDNQIIWILAFSAAVLYLFYTILNHQLDLVKKLNNIHLSKFKAEQNRNKAKEPKKKKITLIFKLKLFIKKIPILKNFILSFFSIFLTINGHTLLIFFFIPVSSSFAIILLTYFILITIFHSLQRSSALKKFKKIN